MDGFTTLLDASAEVTEHPIARLGKFRDARYGTFSITRADFEAWQRKLSASQNGRIPIDYDHAATKPGGSTEAAGWITGLRLDGSKVIGTIEWTPDGAQAVRDKRYLYVSPEFTEHYRDESGKDIGKALLGVALTNRPFLRKGMPAISLCAEQGFAEPVDIVAAPYVQSADTTAASTGNVAVRAGDSPNRMPELTAIAQALSLAEDADEQAITAAITELQEKAEREPVKLTEAAAAEGKVVLDQAAVAELKAQAANGEKALAQLIEQRFTDAFEKALSEVRVDAKPETRENFKALYDANPEATLKVLAEAPKLARTAATPAEGVPAVAEEFQGSGVDEERAELDAKVTKLASEQNITYLEAFDRIAGVTA